MISMLDSQIELNRLVEGAMSMPNEAMRNGYYAGIRRGWDRDTMLRVRAMTNHRLAGGTDAAETLGLLAAAASSFSEAIAQMTTALRKGLS